MNKAIPAFATRQYAGKLFISAKIRTTFK
jgi:hypothetical protein